MDLLRSVGGGADEAPQAAGIGEGVRDLGYPWVPIVFAVSAFGIVANQIVSDPRESVVGLGMVLIGLPVYAVWGRKGFRTRPQP